MGGPTLTRRRRPLLSFSLVLAVSPGSILFLLLPSLSSRLSRRVAPVSSPPRAAAAAPAAAPFHKRVLVSRARAPRHPLPRARDRGVLCVADVYILYVRVDARRSFTVV